MNPVIIKYRQMFDKLPQAAKIVILAVIMLLILAVWYFGFWQDLQASSADTSAKIKTLKENIPKLEQQLKQAAEEAQKKLNVIGTENGTISTKILSSSQTVTVIHDLLKNTGGLKLIQLENLPTREVALPQSAAKVFEHIIAIKFQGDYFSTMSYLQAIENLKWKLFWDVIEYKVINYPIAEVTLYIHTISNVEDWINV